MWNAGNGGQRWGLEGGVLGVAERMDEMLVNDEGKDYSVRK